MCCCVTSVEATAIKLLDKQLRKDGLGLGKEGKVAEECWLRPCHGGGWHSQTLGLPCLGMVPSNVCLLPHFAGRLIWKIDIYWEQES